MYTQFFGNYLLNKQVVTPEQLTEAIGRMKNVHVRLGTIAMHKGLMTAAEVDECCYLQMKEDKRFGEIALERGYLKEDQVNSLLQSQQPDFLLLGQTLVETGVIDNTRFEELIAAYQKENGLEDAEKNIEDKEKIKELINKFFIQAEAPVDEQMVMYLNLLFNNLVRFIGEDFTPMNPKHVSEVATNYCVCQQINGNKVYKLYIDMDQTEAIEFASRYAKEDFAEFDEYVSASMEDFLNLHNGLFVVNVSNEFTYEMTLEPPVHVEENPTKLGDSGIIIPVVYPFGTVNFMMQISAN